MLCFLCSCDNHSQPEVSSCTCVSVAIFRSKLYRPASPHTRWRENTRASVEQKKRAGRKGRKSEKYLPRQIRRQPLLFCDWWMFVFLLPCEPNAQDHEGSVLCSTLCSKMGQSPETLLVMTIQSPNIKRFCEAIILRASIFFGG